jgi:hypothetical protein
MFYRIQNKAGHGPYHSNCLFCTGFTPDKYTCERHPAPSQDSQLVANFKASKYKGDVGRSGDVRPFIFGFSSIEQLRAWFFADEVLSYLFDNGFSLWESNCEIFAGNSLALALKSEFEDSDKKVICLKTLLNTNADK